LPSLLLSFFLFSTFFFNHTPPPLTYTLSLHDALPISGWSAFIGATTDYGRPASALSNRPPAARGFSGGPGRRSGYPHGMKNLLRSEEHTSELQSRSDLVCRLLLEKKKQNTTYTHFFKQ